MKGKKLSVIYVEGEEKSVADFKHFVIDNTLSYRCTFISCRQKASIILQEKYYDCCIIDCHHDKSLPSDILEQNHTPVIALTGIADQNYTLEALKAGVFDCIIKDKEGKYLHLLKMIIERAVKSKLEEIALSTYREQLENIVKARTEDLKSEITKKIKAEEALRRSESKYRMLAENANDVIFLQDADLNITYTSPSSEVLLGYTINEILQLKMPQLLTPDSLHRAHENYTKYYEIACRKQKNIPIPLMQYEYIRKDGSTFWGELQVKFIFNNKGKIIGSQGVLRNIDERQRMEEELRKSNEKYKIIADGVSDIIFILSTELKITYLSPSVEKITGFTIEEALHFSLHDIMPAKSYKKVLSLYDQYIPESKAGKKVNIPLLEFAFLKKNGKTFPGEVKLSFLYNNKGQPTGIHGILRDITERKKIENALTDNQKRYKTLFKSSPIGIALLDNRGNILEVNKTLSKILGYTSINDLKKINIYNLPDPQRHKLSNHFDKCLKSKTAQSDTIEYTSSKEKTSNINYHFKPIKNKDGDVIYILANIEDISKAKNTEKNLRQSKELFKSILLTIPDIVLVLSESGIYKEVFTANEEKLAAPPEVLKGNSIYEFVEKPVGDEIISVIKEVLSTQKLKTTEYPIEINGKILWFQGNIMPIHAFEKECVLWVARDITEKKHTIKQLQKAKEKAEESDLLKSSFLTNMSHEIRTPLNAILGFAELLHENNIPPEERRKYIDIILQRGNDLLYIINDIIDISKIESGQIQLNNEVFSVNHILKKQYDFYSLNKKIKTNNNVDIELETGLEMPDDRIIGDSEKLQQVLTNLLANAVKFTHKGKIVFGYSKQSNNNLLFYVKDSGIGIPKDKIDVVFSRFRQVHEHASREYGGTGLGLAISKELVNLMGGKIWVESLEDKGTTFSFILPYLKAGQKNKKSKHKNTVTADHKWLDKRIMIVEDDATSFFFLKELLAVKGAEIVHASDAEEAIAICRSDRNISLVLMDIRLPGINGYEATKEIKKICSDIAIIAQTAYAFKDDVKKSKEYGCDDHISKPIRRETLYETIEKHL